MPSHLQAAYDARLAQGEIRPDAAQAAALAALVRLEGDLARAEPSGFASFFKKPESQKGVYLIGPVGRGKSMLMDLFYTHVGISPRKRIHFHQFMLETHARIFAFRKSDPGDPIQPVARSWCRIWYAR